MGCILQYVRITLNTSVVVNNEAEPIGYGHDSFTVY